VRHCHPVPALCSAALGLVALGGVALCATLQLFTAEEADAWNQARPDSGFGSRDLRADDGMPDCHALPVPGSSAPQIDILSPTLDRPLTAPLDIDLKFVPSAGSAIRPESFRVCYLGFLTIDITKRITDHIAVLPEGIHLAGAQLPRGHHHLVMLIADQQGHQGRSEATFDIR
jgi:hypothetical protein